MNRKAGTTPSPEAAPLALDLPLEAAAPVAATLQMEVIPGVTTREAAMDLARHMPIASLPTSAPAATPGTPMALLEFAMAQGADLDRLERLMAMQERWEETRARNAFNAAFAAFKAEAVVIIKNIQVTDGPLKGKTYADLFAVVSAITPALSKHGLSASWKLTKDEKDWMEVSCILKHADGHSESVSMGGPPDTGGAKSAIQARASSKSYLERYTLMAITGMAASGEDKDGASGMTFEVEENCQRIAEAKTLQELEATFREVYKKAMVTKNLRAVGEYIKAKDARKGELR